MYYEVVKTIAKGVMHLLWPVTVTFEAEIPKEGPIVMCGKHYDDLDGPIALLIFPRKVNFMAKAELFRFKPLGRLLSSMGAFPVVRGTGDVSALKTALSILKSGGVLGIFPEGTCVHDNERRPAKTGALNLAFKTGATIVPFGNYTKHYRRRLWRRSYFRFGKPMTCADLGMTDGSKADLAAATERLMNLIHDMSEEHYEGPAC